MHSRINLNRLRNRFWRRYKQATGRSYDSFRLNWLPKTLEYRGEFGLELLVFLPFVRWLSERGLLRDKTIVTYKGMRPFYSGLEWHDLNERDEKRTFVPPGDRPSYLPLRDEFDLSSPSPFHSYPDLRAMFQTIPLQDSLEARLKTKPLIVIHNKYTNEWGRGPINHLPLDVIDKTFETFKHNFTVVYIRHGMSSLPADYTEDQNDILHYDDACVAQKHPEVLLFDDLLNAHLVDFPSSNINEFKNALCSRSFRFITSQGGGAHHLAYFSGSIMSILHKEGLEENGTYQTGFYTFLSSPPPLLLVCCDSQDMLLANSVIAEADLVGNAIALGPNASSLAAALSAATLKQRLGARR